MTKKAVGEMEREGGMETPEGRILLENVVVDMNVYPRTAPSEATINRYTEALRAGDEFPPIVLQEGTDILLDGLHRWKAHPLADFDTIAVEHHQVPEGMPLKLYAASLSVSHGDRLPGTDLKQVARDTIKVNPHFSQKEIARRLSVTPKTVSNWTSDITERHRDILKIRALILSKLGHTQEQIAEQLERGRQTITDWLSPENVNGNFPALTEELIQEAVEAWPDENGEITEIVEALREEMIFGHWSASEHDLLDTLRSGEIIVVNMHQNGPHANLVPWLEDTGQLVRVDRKSKWGNPFEMPDDGNRDTVIQKYEEYYLPHKDLLLDNLPKLLGKALGCWCAPQACHGDVLKQRAES